MSPALRAVVADDHAVVRHGLRALLSTAGVEVAAEAVDGEHAVELVLAHRPDVVLMDLEMPHVSGVEATGRIVGAWADAAILVLSMHEGDEAVFAAVRAGARGYVVKHAGPDEILRAVHAVAAGEAIFSPEIATRVLRLFAAAPPRTGPFPTLTDREHELLELIAKGLSNADIARRLVLSPKTVRNHITSIFTKLQVAGRAEAIARARDAGLGGR